MVLNRAFIGRSFYAQQPYQVGREKIRELAAALSDKNPAYHDFEAARSLGHPDLVAPPTFAFLPAFKALAAVMGDSDLGLDSLRVVHGEERFVYVRPIHASDELVVSSEIEAIRVAGRNELMTVRQDLATTSGDLVVRTWATLVSRGTAADSGAEDSSTADSGESTGPGAVAATGADGSPETVRKPDQGAAGKPSLDVARESGRGAARESGQGVVGPSGVEVGYLLAPVSYPITRIGLVRYAGASGDFNLIHWNERIAKRAGLPNVIAHGMLTMAEAARIVTDWAGDPARVVEYEVRFTKPVVVPDDDCGATLEVGGEVVVIRDDGAAVIELDVTCGGQQVLSQAQAVVMLNS